MNGEFGLKQRIFFTLCLKEKINVAWHLKILPHSLVFSLQNKTSNKGIAW